jgi:hypothetical protein
MEHPMPTYPQEITSVRNALLPYVLPAAPAESEDPLAAARLALAEAQEKPSPVVQCVMVFDALKDHVETLDTDGARLLAGCAHLIATNAWHGKGGEALGVRDSAVARLVALEAG